MAVALAGVVLFLCSAIGLYIAGLIIDEQQLDGIGAAGLLWVGLGLGAVLALLGGILSAIRLSARK
ncbi:hypothetical protein HQQ80_06095 [Microbacteriaceae bacterium VKM Ac-2855]|nr:hypothetical protein [Microbacteriaceae bacterium VKM Ac-2855]